MGFTGSLQTRVPISWKKNIIRALNANIFVVSPSWPNVDPNRNNNSQVFEELHLFVYDTAYDFNAQITGLLLSAASLVLLIPESTLINMLLIIGPCQIWI